jgi:hypothetical protein
MRFVRSLLVGLRALVDKHGRNAEIDEELEAYIGESVSEKHHSHKSGAWHRQNKHCGGSSAGASDFPGHCWLCKPRVTGGSRDLSSADDAG